MEGGDLARAVPALEQAVQLGDEVRSRQYAAWFRRMLGEAYLLSGLLDTAREVTNPALDVSTDVGFSLGVGWSHQVLGRIAQGEGRLSEAERHLTEAVRTFVQTGARFEIGRTHLLLASVAHAQGDREAAAQLNEAHAVFRALPAQKYSEPTEPLAKEFAASLAQSQLVGIRGRLQAIPRIPRTGTCQERS